MAYNLPPPWDAGYALPRNVKDEGLENRGFVTKMLPRGTYDNPKVGTGGYAVPSYVKQEQPGQGTYVTKWLPRGTAPNVPHYLDRRPQVVRQQSLGPRTTKVTLNGLGSTAMAPSQTPAVYKKFGAQAAQRILNQIANVPQGSRDAVFKKICDTLDKTLYVRVMQARARYLAAGQQPSSALANALAESIAAGYATEIIKTGASRSVPQPGSLLGLGAYARSGLGADEGAVPAPVDVVVIPGYSWAAATSTIPAHWERTSRGKTDAPGPAGASVSVGATQGGVMTLYPGYSWVPAAGGIPGHWERTKAGATDAPGPQGSSLVVNDHTTLLPGSASGGTASGYAAWVANAANGMGKFIQTGPWLFPENGGKITIDRTPPGAWSQWIYEQLKATGAKSKWCGASSAPAFIIGKPGEKFNVSNLQIDNCPYIGGQKLSLPFFLVQHPTKNEKWGVYASALTAKSYDLEFKKVPSGGNIFGDIWDGIKYLAGKVVDAVKDVVNAIADLACDIASSPGAIAAGAAAGTAAGVGPTVGAAGAAIAQSACYSPPPAPPALPSAGGAGLTTLLLIGGGVAVAAVLLSKKKNNS